jgi:hypothetical protein
MKLGRFIKKYCKDHTIRLLRKQDDGHSMLHNDYKDSLFLHEIVECNREFLEWEVEKLIGVHSFDKEFDRRALNIVIEPKFATKRLINKLEFTRVEN